MRQSHINKKEILDLIKFSNVRFTTVHIYKQFLDVDLSNIQDQIL